MAMVGVLGDIVFNVSSEMVETVSNMKWSGSARYTTHQRHNTHALTEFTGLGADKLSFDIYLSVALGIDPMTELVKIWKYERNHTPLSLVLGTHAYGKHKWVIESHSAKVKYFRRNGDLQQVTVSLSLLEYLTW